ncbi:hypothetical protein LLB_0722 [Legionella longbeachae D-4968]|nr:hypothetical protein LLB_0722 [Legionella longbeachae D-4968]
MDHISSCTSKNIHHSFQKVMLTFCDHLSGASRGTYAARMDWQ